MSATTKYEETKFIFNTSDHVRRALKQGAMPVQLHASPDLIRKFERVIYERILPKRGTDTRPWLRLDDAPAIPFVADRSLKAMTLVLITDKDLAGIAVNLSDLSTPKAPGEKKAPAIVHERVIKDAPSGTAAKSKESSIWGAVKDRMKAMFK